MVKEVLCCVFVQINPFSLLKVDAFKALTNEIRYFFIIDPFEVYPFRTVEGKIVGILTMFPIS